MNEPRIGWICPLCSKTHASHVRDCDCTTRSMRFDASNMGYFIYFNAQENRYSPVDRRQLIEEKHHARDR